MSNNNEITKITNVDFEQRANKLFKKSLYALAAGILGVASINTIGIQPWRLSSDIHNVRPFTEEYQERPATQAEEGYLDISETITGLATLVFAALCANRALDKKKN